MPAPTAPALRLRLLELLHAGQDPPQIAHQLSLPERTVRRLVALARQADAPQDLSPLPNLGRPLAAERQPLRQSCLRLRRDNPGYGAGRIHLGMRKLHPGQPVPPRAPSSAGCARQG